MPLAVATTPPSGACLTHRPPTGAHPWHPADSAYATCSACYDRIHGWLSPIHRDDDGHPDSIPGLYALLDLAPGSARGGRRAPGFGPRATRTDHVIAIRDRRSVKINTPDPHSAPGLLATWVLAIWEQRYEDDLLNASDYFVRRRALPNTVPSTARWIDHHLDWITRRDLVTVLYDELGELHRELRAATGRGGQPPLGHCVEVRDGQPCGAPMFMPAVTPRAPSDPIADLPGLACRECGTVYTGRRLIELRRAREVATHAGHPTQ